MALRKIDLNSKEAENLTIDFDINVDEIVDLFGIMLDAEGFNGPEKKEQALASGKVFIKYVNGKPVMYTSSSNDYDYLSNEIKIDDKNKPYIFNPRFTTIKEIANSCLGKILNNRGIPILLRDKLINIILQTLEDAYDLTVTNVKYIKTNDKNKLSAESFSSKINEIANSCLKMLLSTGISSQETKDKLLSNILCSLKEASARAIYEAKLGRFKTSKELFF